MPYMTGLRLWVDSPCAFASPRAKKIAAPSTRSGSAMASHAAMQREKE